MLTNARDRICKATARQPSGTPPVAPRLSRNNKKMGHIPAFGCQRVLVPDVENCCLASSNTGSSLQRHLWPRFISHLKQSISPRENKQKKRDRRRGDRTIDGIFCSLLSPTAPLLTVLLVVEPSAKVEKPAAMESKRLAASDWQLAGILNAERNWRTASSSFSSPPLNVDEEFRKKGG